MSAEYRRTVGIRFEGNKGLRASVSPEAAELQAKEEQDERDRADGAALRRLREALPEGWELGVGLHITREDGSVTMEITRAATIAAAADRCREELTK